MAFYYPEWRPILGYEGLYEVSSAGQVRSLGARARVLKPQDRKGYRKVMLYRRGSKPRQVNVSTLVLETFRGARPPGQIVLHGSNGAGDDSVANLSWGTHQQNQGPDRIRDGTRSLCGRPRSLSAGDIARARTMRSAGLSFAEIGRHLGVHKETTRRAVRGLDIYRTVT